MPTTNAVAGQVELNNMDDSKRAANNAVYKVNKEQLIKLIECYRQRKYVEDIDYIKDELNGSVGLQDALAVSVEFGVHTASLDTREATFGTNYKEGP
jgi:hypothetical protein